MPDPTRIAPPLVSTPAQPDPTPSAPAALPSEAAWYNRHYQAVQQGMPPWYRFLLPELRPLLRPGMQLFEAGCGQGHILRQLVAAGLLAEDQIHGIDQSQTAVDFLRARLPRARLQVMDLNRLEFPEASFDVVLLMETIEHLADPAPTLNGIARVLKPGGTLFLSFPNYLHLPWWLVRVLAEKLNHPNWIVLQPIDQIYTVCGVVKRVQSAGLRFEGGSGSIYGPPVLYQWEPDALTTLLNRLRLYWASFHPILRFRKP